MFPASLETEIVWGSGPEAVVTSTFTGTLEKSKRALLFLSLLYGQRRPDACVVIRIADIELLARLHRKPH